MIHSLQKQIRALLIAVGCSAARGAVDRDDCPLNNGLHRIDNCAGQNSSDGGLILGIQTATDEAGQDQNESDADTLCFHDLPPINLPKLRG